MHQSTLYCTLQIGHIEKPNVILGPTHLLLNILLLQCRWNTFAEIEGLDSIHNVLSRKNLMPIR
jgi:hypothetical protein